MSDRQLESTGHFGAYLAKVRQARELTVTDVATTTKIPEHQLVRLEAGDLDALPAEVFVRGFVRAYARTVGADADEAMRLLSASLDQRRGPTRRSTPATGEPNNASRPGAGGNQATASRHYGVALVLLLLIAATLALSLWLRRPLSSTGSLSVVPSAARSAPPSTLG